MEKIIELGLRRELFVDDFLIEKTTDIEQKLVRPIPAEIAIIADAPWEDWTFGTLGIIQEEDKIRLYYRAAIPDLSNEDNALFGIAESYDGGRSFHRPELGLIEYNGSKKNNLVWIGGKPSIPSPFIDENTACPPSERYKGFCASWEKLYGMVSADGIRWKTVEPAPLKMKGAFDTINTCFWDKSIKKYRAYTRFYHYNFPVGTLSKGYDDQHRKHGGAYARAIQMALSDDFINWTEPVPLEYEDGDYTHQMYTNDIQPCPGAKHIYIGFPNRIMEGRTINDQQRWPGVNDALFMSSRDGVHWKRWLESWIRPGMDPRNWTQRNNYPTWHIIETSETEWSLLVSEHYMQPDKVPCRLRRWIIRPWGFVSLHADYAEGEIITKPFVFKGSQLRLNYSTSAAGSVRVEIKDMNGKPLDGFSLDKMRHRFGDELDGVMRWEGKGTDVSSLAGIPVKLRFVMRDADVFSFRFA